MKRIALLWHVPVPAVMLVLLGCGGDLTLPGSTAPGLAVAVVRGDGQQGTVGESCRPRSSSRSRPMAVRLLPGRQVAFVVAQGAGAGFDPDTAITNAQGQAVTRWVLGTAVGVYTAEARLVPDGESALPVAPLQATAVPATPTPSARRSTSSPADAASRCGAPGRHGRGSVRQPGGRGRGTVGNVSGSGDAERRNHASPVRRHDQRDLDPGKPGRRAAGHGQVEHADGSPVTFTATVLF